MECTLTESWKILCRKEKKISSCHTWLNPLNNLRVPCKLPSLTAWEITFCKDDWMCERGNKGFMTILCMFPFIWKKIWLKRFPSQNHFYFHHILSISLLRKLHLISFSQMLISMRRILWYNHHDDDDSHPTPDIMSFNERIHTEKRKECEKRHKKRGQVVLNVGFNVTNPFFPAFLLIIIMRENRVNHFFFPDTSAKSIW